MSELVSAKAVKKKLVVLTFVGWYLPGFRAGGPIRSIANMIDQLGDDFDFRIITSDRDLGDLESYQSIKVDAWNQVGKALVFYASPEKRSLLNIAKLMRTTKHDVLYLNSFFNTIFTVKPLLARRFGLAPKTAIVVAPRGELSYGALKLKYWKKLPFLQLAHRVGLFDGVNWHASTDFEASDIMKVIGVDSFFIKTACDLACDISIKINAKEINFPVLSSAENSTQPPTLRICFLSRIAPMKNLDFALKVLAQVKFPVLFHIYGPKESRDYWAECELLIAQLPLNVHAIYGGSVANSQVCSVISSYDLFFVPSRGENFGHVFIEALSAGVPILISDCTPWRDLQNQKLGWDISLKRPEEFVRALEAAAGFDDVTREEMKACCIAYALQKSQDTEALNRNRNIFIDAVSLTKRFNDILKI